MHPLFVERAVVQVLRTTGLGLLKYTINIIIVIVVIM